MMPKIRWTFFFDEGNVQSTVEVEEEDLRIANAVENGEGWLELPGEKTDMHVNFKHVKLICREIIDEEKKPEPAAASA